MRLPRAPFTELQVYCPQAPEAEAFHRFLTVLMERGGQLAGTGSALRGPGVRDAPVADLYAREREAVAVHSGEDLAAILGDPDARLLAVQMVRATGAPRRVREPVRYLSISPEAASRDSHPFSISTDGDLFEGPPGEPPHRSAVAFGQRLYRRFVELVGALDPAYGALGVEIGLASPFDLRHGGPGEAFVDYYVSSAWAGDAMVEELVRRNADAYVERLRGGVYVSTCGLFNPEGRELPIGERVTRARRVAQLLGSVAPSS